MATISILYGVDELAPPGITRMSGEVQYVDRTFEERMEKSGVVIEGEIKDVGTQTFVEEMKETDKGGNQVVFETLQIPRAKVTIHIQKILKDNYGLNSDTVIVYDRDVSDAIGKVNGVKARFVSQNAYDVTV